LLTPHHRCPGFILGQPVRIFWWIKWYGDRFFSKYISFLLSALSHQCLILFRNYRLLIPERQMNKAWETSTSSALSDVQECQIQKYFKTKKPLFIVTS
jgi:hypothetical protein